MSFYFGVLKEPRGLIRLLQFIFAIFAFATACNGTSSLSIKIGVVNQGATASWSYPYDLQSTQINFNGQSIPNSQATYLSKSNSIKPSAEFFVFTGVTSMLLTLAFLIIYVVMDRLYRYDDRLPIIDFIITVIWAIFWIASSCAWAQGVTNIKSQTSYSYVVKLITSCSSATCSENESGTYANVTVSVIFGFLNFVLWFGSVWFVYKETKCFKSRTAQQNPQQNNFSNIESPYPPPPPQNNFSSIGNPYMASSAQNPMPGNMK